MASTVTASDGDTLCNLAVDAGFLNCQPLRDEPKNQTFLTRPLREGDEVTIPDLRPRIESGKTDQVNKFVLKTAPPASIRFVHGSPKKHYLEDDPQKVLNISTFVTNLAGKKEDSHFSDQFEFHQGEHDDPATFKVEVVDPLAGGIVNVVLEARKPVYKADGKTVDHLDSFAGSDNADLRKISSLDCKKVHSGVAYRSRYLRLVVDEFDKQLVPKQTLLVTDTTDGLGGENDRVEILDQQVRASYVITRCPAPDPNKCTVTTQAPIGTDRKRVRLTIHVFRGVFAGIQEQEIRKNVRRRVLKWFRRVYAQASIAPKFVSPEIEFVDPPANNMLVISQNTGNPSTGFTKTNQPSKLSFDLFTAAPSAQPNFVRDATVSVNLKPSQTPSDVGQAVSSNLPPGYQPQAFTNATAFNALPGSSGSCDVLITRQDGKLVDIRTETTDDATLSVTVARVDINKVVISERDRDLPPGPEKRRIEDLDLNGAFSSTPEQRRTIRAAPRPPNTLDRLDFYVVGLMVERKKPDAPRELLTRGTTLIAGKDFDSDLRPHPPLHNTCLLASFVMDKGDSEPFVLPHEAGHAMMDVAGHVEVPTKDFGKPSPTLTSQLMFGNVSAENAVIPSDRSHNTLAKISKRISDDSVLVNHDLADPANSRSRGSVERRISEVKRLRERGQSLMQDWDA